MKPQSRPGCNPGGGSFAPGWSLYSLPGLFSVPPQATPGRWTERKSHSPGTAAHRWTQPPRVQAVPYTHAHSRHRGRTEPRNRARVQGHRQAPKQATEPPTAAHRGKQSTAPETYTAGNTIYSPTEPRRAGVLSLYYHSRKRRTGAHRAAHRGQAAGGTETPGRTSPQPPQPRHSTPGENPGGFL